MRIPAIILFSGTLAASAVAQPAGQPGKPPQPAATPAPQPAPTPPAAQTTPVPDGPVVNHAELEGGLIVDDLKIGDGYEVKPDGWVVAMYHGTLKSNGACFDSTYDPAKGHPEPMPFSLNGVIQGWTKGLPGMKVGGIRRLTIPAALAYGERSPTPDIPPNSDLVFVIQLVDALRFEDVKVGDGPACENAFVPVTAHTITDEKGKEIESWKADQPYVWLPGEMMFDPRFRTDAIQLALNGMKVGGERKIHIPAAMNVKPPLAEFTRPDNTALDMDVNLIAVRNLPRQPSH